MAARNEQTMRRGIERGKKPDPTILVVEDNTQLRRAITLMLSIEGYTVWEAETADQAMEILSNIGTPDLVLTDVQMPGDLDGLDLLVHLKQSSPDLPVVVMSAYPHSAESAADVLARADLFLEKPVALSILSLRLKSFLGEE